MKVFLNWLAFNCFLFSCSFTCQASSESLNTLGDVPRISGDMNIDGRLTEPQWSDALEVYLNFEVEPGENIPSRVGTRALLFEDGENLYVAFEASDSEPSQIRAYLSDRDRINLSDSVSITLDTFNDSRRAFEFSVNPLGIQADSVLEEQTNSKDDSWDAIWYSAGLLTTNGFNVEIKIPFKALRFPESQSVKRWGILLNRTWRRQVTHLFSNEPKDRNIACQLCQMSKVNGFKDVPSPNNITLIPSLTFLSGNSRPLADDSSWSATQNDTRASLDLRWGLTQDTYLNATINPDFSQVEADSLQLDINNLSSLSLVEKRPFFQDGADYFSNWSKLVYTRIFEEPEYGIKLTGKQDKHSYGYIALEDKHTHLLFPYEYGTRLLKLRDTPSENQIFRYRFDLGDNGHIGTTITNRQAEDYQNLMVSLDGKFWMGENDSLRFQLMSSDSEYPDEIPEFLLGRNASGELQNKISGNAYSVNYEHSDRDWDWSATYHQFGEKFRADAGFIGFGNWKRLALTGGHTWYSNALQSWWKKFNITTSWIDTKQIDNSKLDQSKSVFLEVDAIYESTFGVDLIQGKQYYLSNEYELQTQSIWGEFNPLANLAMNFEYMWGDEIDYSTADLGDVRTIILGANWQLSQHINTELEFIEQSLEANLDEIYDIKLINFRTSYQLDMKSFIRLTLQAQRLDFINEDSQDEDVATQLIYSYKVNPFTLFYLGYSDKYRSEASNFDLKKTDRTLFLKFSYAWQA